MRKFQLKTVRLALIALSLFCMGSMYAQKTKIVTYHEKVTDPTANFYEIVAQKRAEFASMDLSIKANNKEMKQFERWAYIWKDRVNADGSFPSAVAQKKKDELFLDAVNLNRTNGRIVQAWEQVGPLTNPAVNGYDAYPGKGRVNVVVADPTNTNIMYAGTPDGGIWKTTDNGVNWTPKSDNLAGLGVSDIIIDPANSNIIYMATGDADASHIASLGVFKSVDAGETWLPTGLTFTLGQQDFITDITFAPGSSTTIFALTNTEIKRSTDSGATWTNIPVTSPFDFTERFQNIIFDPNDSNKVIVSDAFEGIYFSTDGGNTFALHDVFQGGDFLKKLKLTATPADNDFFYALNQDGLVKKYRYNFNNTAADLVRTTTIAGYNSQGGYDQCIAVSPTNANNMVVGGVRGLRSTDNGQTFQVFLNPYNNPPGVGFYVHPDHHHFSFLADGVTVLNGHDGGIHKGPFNSTSLSQFIDLSDRLMITQPYHISVTQEVNGDNFMMGNQDNDGFSKILKDGTRQWVSAVAGDGTGTGIDIVNSNIRYLGGTNGALYRADNGYADGYDQSITLLGPNNNADFVSPFEQHPTNANIIYAGYGDIRRSANKGANFTATSSGLTFSNFLNVTANNTSIRLYAIGSNGAKRSDNDGGSWTTVNPPAGVVLNSFAAVPNSTTVYATVSGYSIGNKVYKSTDSGVTWTNISGDLPNIVMKKIFFKRDSPDETLYLGTELGVYWKNNTMTNFEKLGNGLPNVIITDLEMNYTDQFLYVGTFGRSLWRISTLANCPGVTKTWNGTLWSPAGAPTENDTVIIEGNYNTATNGGSINACSLTISNTSVVTVGAGDFISVNNEVVVNAGATLDIQHEGSFLQVNDDALVTNNGTINVRKTTPTLAARSFMILSSPMSAETRTGAYGSFVNVQKYFPALFVPNPAVAASFPLAINFADDNGDDWQVIPSGTATALDAGLSNLVIPQATPQGSGSANINYTLGTLNNGTITAPVQFNGSQNGSSNLLGNPYASAIDATLLRNSVATNAALFDVLYFWEHLTPPSTSYPGYNSDNYSMGDISQFNAVSNVGLPAANGGLAPNKFIASGKGFGIKAKAAGTISYNNSMRVAGNNTNYRDTNMELFYVNIVNNGYGLSSTTAVNFTESATNGFDDGYDTKRLATPVSVYGKLDSGEELGIQSRASFNVGDKVALGFSSQIKEEQKYIVSINNVSGNVLKNTPIYLWDTYAATITNLTESSTTGELAIYEFTSNEGNYADRFILLFKNPFLDIDDNSLQSVGVIPNPTTGIINIISPQNPIKKIAVFDVGGRKVKEVEINELDSYKVDLSALKSAIYFVKVETENGLITKKVIKQ